MTEERPPYTPPPLGPRRLARSKDDNMIAGVCGGIAEYLGVDATLVRIGFALLSLTGVGLVAYALGWALLPEEGQTGPRWRPPWQLAGIAVLIWCLANWVGVWSLDDITFPLALLVIGAVLVWGARDGDDRSRRADTQPPPPTGPPLSTAVVEQTGPGRWSWSPPPPEGTTLAAPAVGPEPEPRPRRDHSRLARAIAVGTGGLFMAVGAIAAALALSGSIAPTVTLGAAVALFGVIMVAGSWWGWARPLAFGGLLLVLALSTVAVINVPLRGGIDDRIVRPDSLADLPATERLAIGDLTLDLTDIAFTGDERHLEATVGIGQLTVIVPAGVTVELGGDVGVGVIDAFELQEDGWTPVIDRTFEGTGSGRIELDLEVGIGHVEVRRG